jgi:DNA-binding PadR family transcriptional regulator
VLELAILGILHESPMHGYELRKQLITKLGAFRAAISYGSLYPTLRRLQSQNWITEGSPESVEAEAPPMTSKRGKVVYKITAEGKERFQELLAQAGPETFDDPAFGIHFAFFARTDQQTRLRILEGRRRRVEERREGLRDVLAGPPSDSTPTRWNCNATDWTPPSARSGGWRSSSPPSAPARPQAGVPPQGRPTPLRRSRRKYRARTPGAVSSSRLRATRPQARR